jgi:predicted amidohydrolase YtcJ
MKILIYICVIIIAFSSCKNSPPSIDLIIHNGTIYTLNIDNPTVEAVVISDGKIMTLGTSKEMLAYKTEQTETLDLEGRAMIPGFIDSHAHLLALGKAKRRLDFNNIRSYEEMIDMVEAAVKKAKPGEWILGRGWHQSKWKEIPNAVTGYQTHEALSAISPDNPVMLTHSSGHAIFANKKAMKMANISKENLTVTNEDGEIMRYPDGAPTGIFTENAEKLITAFVPADTKESLKMDLDAAIAECLKHGITSFQDAGSDAKSIEIYRAAIQENKMNIRLWVMLSASGTKKDSLLEAWYDKGIEIGDWLTIRAIKLYADGALGSRGAWLIDEYMDRKGHYGNLITPLDVIQSVSKKGAKYGFQVCTHAIGTRANREVLNSYEAAFKSFPDETKDHRFRIEHSQHVHPDDIPRFSQLGVIASMQAIHFSSDRPWAIYRLGQIRIAANAYRWRQFVESGAKVINGTDAPIEPINPIPCFYTTVTRKTLRGQVFEEDQKLSRIQGLQSYTLDAAYGAFEEKVKGSIEVGKFADFAILSQDIMTVPDEQILETVVDYTIVGGEIKYERK